MSRDNDSLPNRGETYYEGETPDLNNLSGVELEGQCKVFEDINWGDRGIKSFRQYGRQCVCRLVRNLSGITLLGKRLVQLDPTNPGRITGYANVAAQEAYPLDEFLPASGVPNGDLCWIVVKGPAVVLTPMLGADFSAVSIVPGDSLCALTTVGASTATGTTAAAGRAAGFLVGALTTAAQFTGLRDFCLNNIGRAMSGKTSGQTNVDILVDINRDKGGHP